MGINEFTYHGHISNTKHKNNTATLFWLKI